MDNRETYNGKTPFYMTYPMQNLYLAEMEYEKDMERMKEMYPKEINELQKMVEHRADQMEYEGSRMYDENPDREMLREEAQKIFLEFLEWLENHMDTEEPEDMRPMPMQPMPMQPMPMQPMEPMRPMQPMQPSPVQPNQAIPQGGRFMLQPPREWGELSSPPILSMEKPLQQAQRPGTGGCGQHSWLCQLTEVLFQNEVYRRRCRQRRCRRWW